MILTLEESFCAELNAHSGYSALCGQRTFPDAFDESEAVPQTVFMQFSGYTHDSHDGAARTEFAGFQFASYGNTALEAIQVQAQLIRCFQAVKSRVMGAANGVRVSWVKISKGPSGYEPTMRKPYRITEARFYFR